MLSHNKDYETEVKHAWRLEVWQRFTAYTGLQKIPRHKQYWTLGDKVLREGGRLAGELLDLKQYGLLEDIRSFYSVNYEEKKAMNNYPPCGICNKPFKEHNCKDHGYFHAAGWSSFYGNIAEVVPIFHRYNNFHPSFINLDTNFRPAKAYELAGLVGRYCPPGAIMAINVVQRYRATKATDSEARDFKQSKWLANAKLLDSFSYKNDNCKLVTVFLEF